MSEDRIAVRYVGFKSFKRDTVAGTLHIWPAHGSVQMVAREAAMRLLQFPSVWVDDDLPEPVPLKRPVVNEVMADDDSDTLEQPQEAATPDLTAPEPVEPTEEATEEELLVAFHALDPENDLTDQGRPKIEAVRKAIPGKIVNIALIKKAWLTFKGGE